MASEWLEMCNTLRDKGYSEPQIAAFNRLSLLEFRQLRAAKIKLVVKSAEETPPIIEEVETNE